MLPRKEKSTLMKRASIAPHDEKMKDHGGRKGDYTLMYDSSLVLFAVDKAAKQTDYMAIISLFHCLIVFR
jgi:hypothetical protein